MTLNRSKHHPLWFEISGYGENGSQTDEEFDGGHCCEASANLLEMNAKLDKLLTLFGEIETLKTRLTNLE